LLHYLQQHYGDVLNRVWHEGTKTIALFIHAQYTQPLTVLLEHDEQDGRCKLTVVGGAGQRVSTETTFLAVVKEFENRLDAIAMTCSNCGTAYYYQPDTLKSGKARCQNCGRPLA
jgi:hypothetical protein